MKQNTVEPNLNSTLDSTSLATLHSTRKIVPESTAAIPSELEKEWARFFDRLGIEWEYVPAKSAFFLPALSTATINPLSEHARRYHVVSHQSFYLQVKDETPSQGEVADFIRFIPDDNGYIAIGSPSDIKDTPALRLSIPGNLYIKSQIVKLARYWYFGECANCQRVQLYSVAHKTCPLCKEEAVHFTEHLKGIIEQIANVAKSHEAGETAATPAGTLKEATLQNIVQEATSVEGGYVHQGSELSDKPHVGGSFLPQDAEIEKDMVSISEAARILGIKPHRIYKWIANGFLSRQHDKNKYLVSFTQASALMARNRPLAKCQEVAATENAHPPLADQQSTSPAGKLTVDRKHYEGMLIHIGQLENETRQLIRLVRKKDQELSEAERLLSDKDKVMEEAGQKIRELQGEIEMLKKRATIPWWKRLLRKSRSNEPLVLDYEAAYVPNHKATRGARP